MSTTLRAEGLRRVCSEQAVIQRRPIKAPNDGLHLIGIGSFDECESSRFSRLVISDHGPFADDRGRVADHSSRMLPTAAGGWPDRGRLRALWPSRPVLNGRIQTDRGRLRALSVPISAPPGLQQRQAGPIPPSPSFSVISLVRDGAAVHQREPPGNSVIQMFPVLSSIAKTALSAAICGFSPAGSAMFIRDSRAWWKW